MSVRIWRGGPEHSALLARLHKPSFSDAWPEEAFRSLTVRNGVIALMASRQSEGAAEAFILISVVAEESEVLTFSVVPEARRSGLGRALLDAACEAAAARGVREIFLEVGEQNAAARALYRGRGFVEVGRRTAYYNHGPDAADALVMRKALTTD